MPPSFRDIYSFEHLHDAHRAARRGKRDRFEVIDFELDLSANLVALSRSIEDGTYQPLPYARFVVDDPKRRVIHALRYRDRVVQHSLCDNVLGLVLEPRLIHDNAACRRGKGTHFALDRLEYFLREHYRVHGASGWFLKCDVHHFFASIDHVQLKALLRRPPFDDETYRLLSRIIDSCEDSPGRGLPLGNQSSQWFALYYLDSIDRLVKERMHVRGYVRYMDDMVLVHSDRGHLRECLSCLRLAVAEIGLSFNAKTQIAPLSQGIDFLGWHLYVTKTGAVIRRLRQSVKRRLYRRLTGLDELPEDVRKAVLTSYRAHLSHGDAKALEMLCATRFC